MRAAGDSPITPIRSMTSRGEVSPLVSRRLAGVRRIRRLAEAPAIPAVEPSPLHSFEALAGAMFVATVAAGWIALTSTTTAPLVAAGELLGRAVRVLDR